MDKSAVFLYLPVVNKTHEKTKTDNVVFHFSLIFDFNSVSSLLALTKDIDL